MVRKRLRSGYTTGACAAAAKAAAMILLNSPEGVNLSEIPFPDSTRVSFTIHESGLRNDGQTAWHAETMMSGIPVTAPRVIWE